MANDRTNVPERQRYSREASRQRVHMGTASANNEYLPLTRRSQDGLRELEKSDAQSSVRIAKPKLKSNVAQYNNYLQVSTRHGKQIFTNEMVRRQRRSQHLVVFGLIALVVLAVVWFFFLR